MTRASAQGMSGPEQERSGDRLISYRVRALLRGRIHTFEELEVLLLLHRSQRSPKPEHAIAAELDVSTTVAADAVAVLQRQGLVEMHPSGIRSFRYAVADSEVDEAIRELALEYRRNRLEVIKLMTANSIERIRTSAMRAFAGAFVLRGEKGEPDR
jgi:hypothetical protein